MPAFFVSPGDARKCAIIASVTAAARPPAPWFAAAAAICPPPDVPPDVLHVDDWLIVADKPAGLLSVQGKGPEGEDCLHARLCRRWPDALVVHRLDMATSGLMVFARHLEAQRRLSRAFERRTVGKRYVAVVAGRVRLPSADAGAAADEPAGKGVDAIVPPDAARWATIDLPLIADWVNRPRQIVDVAHGRPSRTRWRPDGDADGAWGEGTRVLLEPFTGRSHQLRVHLMSIGHPIVGDPLYASEALWRASPRLLLHAQRLALIHPETGLPLVLEREAPF